MDNRTGFHCGAYFVKNIDLDDLSKLLEALIKNPQIRKAFVKENPGTINKLYTFLKNLCEKRVFLSFAEETQYLTLKFTLAEIKSQIKGDRRIIPK